MPCSFVHVKRGWQWKCFSALWLCSCVFVASTPVWSSSRSSALPSGVIGTALQWSHTQDCHSLIASECLQTCSLLYPRLHLVKDQRSSKRAGETSSLCSVCPPGIDESQCVLRPSSISVWFHRVRYRQKVWEKKLVWRYLLCIYIYIKTFYDVSCLHLDSWHKALLCFIFQAAYL